MSDRNDETGYDWKSHKPRIGISTCLLGERVRHDGSHRRDRLLTDVIGEFVQWVPVCPEMECGLPVPRESMHLEGSPESPRLITTRSRVDHTDRMLTWCSKRLKELEKDSLCGFIFRKKSPSSGMERVRVYDEEGVPRARGAGIFAMQFMQHFPLLPVEEDGRLHDHRIRENFIERIFCLMRYRELLATNANVGGLVDFHTDHKIQIMAHNQKVCREMGALVAHAKGLKKNELFTQYERLLLSALARKATSRSNANALMHMMGYFKRVLTADEKQELLGTLDQYRGELVPLIVPITLIRHYVRKYEQSYLRRQTYLNPHPVELKLRNHA
jgi:uncharacterized protein YbgA (DUF1722 family)/uncharacterized protein YbbK (DUF523 family)